MIRLISANCALGSDWILLMVAKYARFLIKPTKQLLQLLLQTFFLY